LQWRPISDEELQSYLLGRAESSLPSRAEVNHNTDPELLGGILEETPQDENIPGATNMLDWAINQAGVTPGGPAGNGPRRSGRRSRG
jgi:hypothetical protein